MGEKIHVSESNGFDIKNTSDYMVPQRIPLMKTLSIELRNKPSVPPTG